MKVSHTVCKACGAYSKEYSVKKAKTAPVAKKKESARQEKEEKKQEETTTAPTAGPVQKDTGPKGGQTGTERGKSKFFRRKSG